MGKDNQPDGVTQNGPEVSTTTWLFPHNLTNSRETCYKIQEKIGEART